MKCNQKLRPEYHIPDQDYRGGEDYNAGLDLVIEVPQGINAEISDGSGDAKIYNVGALEAIGKRRCQ